MLALASFTALLLALETEALVRVEGTSVCPRADDVASRLERRLPPRPAGVEPDRASVDLEDGQLRLTLVRPDGTVVGEKRFDSKASCAEMAEAVAIVIAIWEKPLRAGAVPPPELPTESDAETVVPGETRAERVETPPTETRATAIAEKPAPSDRPEPSPSDAGRAPWRFETGAAVQTVFPSGMPGALVEGALRARAGLGPRIAFGGAWWNEAGLGAGHVSWTRLTASLGLIEGWSGPRLFLDLREQFVAAALVARGRGYDRTQTRTAFDPGVEAGIRGGMTLSPFWRLWVDVGLAFWPVPQELRVDGVDQTIDAAPFTWSVSLGGTFLSAR